MYLIDTHVRNIGAMNLRTDEETREEFKQRLEMLGGTKAEAIIMKEVGFKVSRSTFYKVRDGNCKPTLLHLLTYALRKAVENTENHIFVQSLGRGVRKSEGKPINEAKG